MGPLMQGFLRILFGNVNEFALGQDGYYMADKRFLRSYWRVIRFGLLLGLAIAILGLVGYVTGAKVLYQPLPTLPGSHPTTLIASAALLCVMLSAHPLVRLSHWQLGALLLAAAIALWRLVDLSLGIHPDWQGFFLWAVPVEEIARRAPVFMGPNTAVAILAIAGGQLLRYWHLPGAFTLAVFGPFLPVASAFGYAYGNDLLHGHMSPPTVIMLLPAGLGGLLHFAHRHGVRFLVWQSPMNALARRQVFYGSLFVFGLGMLFTHIPMQATPELMSLFSSLIIWFFVGLIAVGTWAHARTDFDRRMQYRQQAELSVQDDLTGVLNRRGAEIAARGLETKSRVGVVMLDLDFFKNINDQHGHAAGDRVLEIVGRLLSENLRSRDVVARWGGEEFLIFLPDTAFEDVVKAAERFRKLIEKMHVPGLPPSSITASLGVALKVEADMALESAIIRADSALYDAKENGRNRVALDDFSTADKLHRLH